MTNKLYHFQGTQFILKFQAWRDLDLDVLIAPGFGTPSMPVKDPARLVPLTAYTNVYNVLDLPAGSLPVEVYTQDDQVRSFVFLTKYVLLDAQPAGLYNIFAFRMEGLESFYSFMGLFTFLPINLNLFHFFILHFNLFYFW